MLTGLSIWLSNVFRLGLKELASLASDKVLFTFIIYSFGGFKFRSEHPPHFVT